MSDENAETVREMYGSWARGDFRPGEHLFDPHVEFVMPPDLPDSGVYVGLDRLNEYTRQFLEPWVRLTIEAEEITAAGDTVLAAVKQSGVGQESGIPTELRYFQVWTFRGGSVIRLENFRDREAAYAAAGLPA